MSAIEKTIEVAVPIRMAYNQWTQFEDFPEFMEGVTAVKQLDDKRLRWHAEVLGKDLEWTAEITQQIPDRQIAWRSTSGSKNEGSISFEPVDAAHTKLKLRMEYEPEGGVETVGSAIGLFSGRVEGDLRRFKEFIEARLSETGAWRGAIRGPEVKPSPRR